MKIKLNRAALILQWIVFAAFVGFGFGWMGPMQEISLANTLQSGGAHASGQVQSVKNGDFLNSASVSYSFTVSGREYYGYSQLGGSKTPSLAPGTTLQVVYSPSDPSKNSVDLDGLRESGKHGLVIAGVLEVIVAAIFLPMILLANRVPGGALSSRTQPPGNIIAGLVIVSIMVIAGLSALFFGVIPDYFRASRLVTEGRPAVAQITAVYDHDKGKGRYAEYSFEVNGVSYNGQADYKGDYSDRGPLNIRYLPDNPSYSTTKPEDKVANARIGIVFMIVWNLLAMGAFVGVLFQWRKTRLSL